MKKSKTIFSSNILTAELIQEEKNQENCGKIITDLLNNYINIKNLFIIENYLKIQEQKEIKHKNKYQKLYERTGN